MIYVVGTGRCGTGSMAVKLKGMHEPEPRLTEFFDARFNCEAVDLFRLMDCLEKRSKLNTPAISDFRQSLFIDEIHSVDPSAEFIWLIRQRDDCLRSMLQRHTPMWDSQYKVEVFYDCINRRIEESLTGKHYKQINTENIGEPKLNGINQPLAGSNFT